MATTSKKPRRRKLGARIDLPPLNALGPWPEAEIGDGFTMVPRHAHRSEVISDIRRERELPRHICAGELVPQRVREHYADLWREEQIELLQAERDAWHRWCNRTWRFRLIDRLLGRQAPHKPGSHVPHTVVSIHRTVPLPFTGFY